MKSNLPQSQLLAHKALHISVDEAIPPSSTAEITPAISFRGSIISVNNAIATSVSNAVSDSLDKAEPSDWWWDQQFVSYSEEQFGRYGVW